jgi:hypothetical protein
MVDQPVLLVLGRFGRRPIDLCHRSKYGCPRKNSDRAARMTSIAFRGTALRGTVSDTFFAMMANK